MARLGVVLCALFLAGCNSVLPGISAPEANVPMAQGQLEPEVVTMDTTGTIVPPPLADLDCAPRAGEITCR
ncbi:MAG: hypothetical protein JWN07_1460 [Hyphomicrobiales bacterium]|nr:hypothetical protein [Hyphomicrobiales bacterium]